MNSRDDREILDKIGIFKKMLLGLAMYVPFSFFKVFIYKLLGADIGNNVYLGPGTLILSHSYGEVHLGNGVFIAPGTLINVNRLIIGEKTHLGYQSLLIGDSLTIGTRCNISNRAFVEASYAPVTIEDEVTIAASVIISSHDGAYRQTRGLEMKKAPVLIKHKAFIGNNAIVLPGIAIGKSAIVGAGAVVTRDVGDNVIVAGVPAKTIIK